MAITDASNHGLSRRMELGWPFVEVTRSISRSSARYCSSSDHLNINLPIHTLHFHIHCFSTLYPSRLRLPIEIAALGFFFSDGRLGLALHQG